MNRRGFIAAGGRTATLAVASSALQLHSVFARAANPALQLGRDLAALVQAFDGQGNHRTATDGDAACAQWLSKEVRRAGAEPSLEPFALSRVDPQSCHASVGGRRIDGLPLFDAGFTPAEGVGGRLGPLGSDAEIGLAESEPSRLTDPGSEGRRAYLSEIRQSKHKAVGLLTRGAKPGLYLLNAPSFAKPFGPPALPISSTETEFLKQQAQARADPPLAAPVARAQA